MNTTGTVSFTTGTLTGNYTIGQNGHVFPVSQTGSWPTTSYRITGATITYYRSQRGNVTMLVCKCTSGGENRGTLHPGLDTYFSNSEVTQNLSSRTVEYYRALNYLKVAGNGGTAGTIPGGHSIDIVVTWELTESKATFTTAGGEAGSSLALTITEGEQVARMEATVTMGSRSTTETVTASGASVPIPIAWCEGIPNGTSANATVTLTSYGAGGNVIGTYDQMTTITVPASVVPTITSVTMTPTETRLNGLTLEGIGGASFAVTAEGAYGSTVQTYTYPTGAGGSTTTTAASYSTGPLTGVPAGQSTETRTLTVTVTDSRGRTASWTGSILIYHYSRPTLASVTEVRATSGGTADPQGTYIKCTVDAQWTSIKPASTELNPCTLQIWYGHGSLTKDLDTTLAASGSAAYLIAGGNANPQYSYTVRYVLADEIGSVTIDDTLPTGTTYMVWDPAHNATGFGAYPTGSNMVYLDPGITLMIGNQTLAQYIQSIINGT